MTLDQPKVMGIINTTPDSFYAGSRRNSFKEVLETAESMLNDGADFLDLGAYSSRPNAKDISPQEEIDRVVPFISKIKEAFPECLISIDTFRSEVAEQALEAGADMVNDISGGHLDQKMIELVGKRKVPYVAMHMRGTPQTMQQMTDYDDLLAEVTKYFAQVREKTLAAGIHDLIIDPGFGFAKTLEQNYDLLNHLSFLHALECPILVGVSRKSMVYRLLDTDPENALVGTVALNAVALLKGADILRVHDVKEAVQVTKLIGQLNDSGV